MREVKMLDSNRSEKRSNIGAVVAVTLALYLSSLHSYLLFHSLIEIAPWRSPLRFSSSPGTHVERLERQHV
jgi:hypothetical protein